MKLYRAILHTARTTKSCRGYAIAKYRSLTLLPRCDVASND